MNKRVWEPPLSSNELTTIRIPAYLKEQILAIAHNLHKGSYEAALKPMREEVDKWRAAYLRREHDRYELAKEVVALKKCLSVYTNHPELVDPKEEE